MEDIKPTTPAPSGPPVNDITAPLPAPVGAKFDDQPSDTPDMPPAAAAPSNEVQPAPATEAEDAKQPESDKKSDLPDVTEEPQAEVNKPKVPKQHGSGLAIFAAVVIVLGVAAMFTYAYLQTQ